MKVDPLLEEAQRTTRLLAILVTTGKKQREQIALLSQAGFPPKEIAELIGTTSNTVRVALAMLRKSRK